MTYVYQKLSTSQIVDALRQDDNSGWSADGAWALAEWLEDMAEETGEPIELDVVALRCEFSEYETAGECTKNYSISPQQEKYNDDEEWEAACLAWLQDNTCVIEFNGGIIVQDF